ncbi:MAG: hypothetical protein IT181_20180 [Acidobacteria bacterium]|nr:hypothetical protein [Acidobacteriota bacterium]
MSTGPSPIYWHRDLPPLDAEVMDEHVVEAVSARVAGAIEPHGDLWERCHASLIAQVRIRLAQEMARLGGDYAHVVDEHVDSRRDDATSESWLHGRFSYVLYRAADDGINPS